MAAPDPIPDLLKAVNEASGKAFALWITFLTVGTYLAIAIGTTTHLQFCWSPGRSSYRCWASTCRCSPSMVSRRRCSWCCISMC